MDIFSVRVTGIKCDTKYGNKACGWKDANIPEPGKTYRDYIGHRCPWCNEITITEEHCRNTEAMINLVKNLNDKLRPVADFLGKMGLIRPVQKGEPVVGIECISKSNGLPDFETAKMKTYIR